MSGSLRGRTALVTGASRGIGRSIAIQLAGRGTRVVLVARSAQDLAAVASEAGDATPMVADLGNRRDLDRLTDQLASAGIVVDLLVNNAGTASPVGPFVGVDRRELSDAMGINLLGPMHLTRTLLPGMLERGFGRLLHVSSGVADMPGLRSANTYSVSKAGLEMFSANLAVELEGTGVTSNVIRPGTVDTAMQDTARAQPEELVGEQFHGFFHGLKADGRLISPEEPARLVAGMLASDLNGRVIRVGDDQARALLGEE